MTRPTQPTAVRTVSVSTSPSTMTAIGRVIGVRKATLFAIAVPLSLGSLASLQSGPGLSAQEPDQDTVTTFRVTAHLRDADTDTPLMGALIELSGHSRRYVTAMNGRVSFEVPADRYTLTAHKGGYATLRVDFRVERPGELNILMHELGDLDTSVPDRLLVRVTESGSGRLMEGATVSLPGGRARMTDRQGWVEFRGLAGPVAEITVRNLGYEPHAQPVSLRAGRTTVIEVAMAIDALVLRPIEVRAQSTFLERQGVYWRIDRGWPDRLLTSEELVERADPRLADAFRNLFPGIRPDYHGHLTFLVNHLGCRIPVYMDGQPLGSDVRGLNIDDIRPEELELAEFYEAGRIPARFGGVSECGLVLLWSRRRAGREGS
ncbi:MAG: carboxypeptidase regulatory-like domain-containing protein [Gemmatimonadetes bacterium]|nr:carboxypeptidase regulatory-like domain-containing protein [Gemmatimonadota bacterium]